MYHVLRNVSIKIIPVILTLSEAEEKGSSEQAFRTI